MAGLSADRRAGPRSRPEHSHAAGHRRGLHAGDRARGEGVRGANVQAGVGFHPLWSFVDHGAEGTGEPLSFLLRAGNAGSNTVADHKAVIRAALAQLPGGHARGKKVLVRIDGAGGTHELLAWLTRRRLSYSVGLSLPGDLVSIQKKLASIPADAWEPAYYADDQPREGAFIAEVTDLFDLSGWPTGMRLIVRKERPHPGAQLRITDVDGMRITAFVPTR